MEKLAAWSALAGPAGLPAEVTARWGDALLKAQQYAYRQSASLPGASGQWFGDLARTECLLGDPALIIFSKVPHAGGDEPKGKF